MIFLPIFTVISLTRVLCFSIINFVILTELFASYLRKRQRYYKYFNFFEFHKIIVSLKFALAALIISENINFSFTVEIDKFRVKRFVSATLPFNNVNLILFTVSFLYGIKLNRIACAADRASSLSLSLFVRFPFTFVFSNNGTTIFW